MMSDWIYPTAFSLPAPKTYGTIYIITCLSTGERYIGQTVRKNVKRRIDAHFYYARKGRIHPLNASIRKYGESSFSFEILGYAEDQIALDFLEDIFITIHNTMYPNGFNLRRGGGVGKMSAFVRKRMADAQKEVLQRPDFLERRGASLREAFARPEVFQRRSDAQKIAQNKPNLIAAAIKRLNTPDAIKRRITTLSTRPSSIDKLRTGKDTQWITNGITSRRLKKGEPLPNGWYYGKTHTVNSKSIEGCDKGRHIRWHTNKGIKKSDCKFCAVEE